MTQEKINKFKNILEAELNNLETELKTVAQINPENPGDWEPVPTAMNTDQADRIDVADNIEGFENNIAILNSLETKFNEVKDALKSIEEGSYGKCIECGKEIEEDRLGANPSSKTCKEHMNA